MLKLRPATNTDYEPIADVLLAADPEYAETAAALRDHDARPHPDSRHGRIVAQWNERVVGAASYYQPREQFHPGLFWADIHVVPDYQRRGIGGALYDALLTELAKWSLTTLSTWVCAARPESCRFFEKRGHVEVLREWESRLDLTMFDPARFADALDRVEGHVRLLSLPELADDPDRNGKLADLMNVLESDVPSSDPATPMTVEQLEREELGSVTHLPEGWFIAVDGDRYVGYSALHKDLVRLDCLETGLTGVRREYRRRGIARALKVRAATFAKERGYREVRTWNSVTNTGMLAINTELGFVRQPAWIQYQRKLQLSEPLAHAQSDTLRDIT
jgi:mycothiol synthase